MRAAIAGAAAVLLAACGAFGASASLPKEQRAAEVAPENVAWRPATREDVVGWFESERVTGEAAASLRRVWYSFGADGTYSGAALVQEHDKAAFQTLSGKWSLENGTLNLGEDTPPAKAFAAPDRLRLDAEGGSATFRRGKAE